MIISDLDYADIELVFEKNSPVGGTGFTWTQTYALTSAGPGNGTADAGAIGIGQQSLAATFTSVDVYQSETITGYSTEKTYYTSAFAIAGASASSVDSLSLDSSESYSEYYFHSIEVKAVAPDW